MISLTDDNMKVKRRILGPELITNGNFVKIKLWK